MSGILIERVSKTFSTNSGPVRALQDISLDISDGRFVSILGPSGCGKSTLLSIVAGLERASEGSVRINDKVVTAPPESMGLVFQDSLLLDWRDALGNVLLQVEARRLPKEKYRERAIRLLDQVGLAGFEHKRPWELSGGMKQRVSICRALVHEPSILLFDEPFGPLDALTREQLMLDLHDLWLEGRQTVLFVTHSISEAVFLGDNVVVMTDRPGRVREVVDTSDLGTRRSLETQATPTFHAHVDHIHSLFRELGVLGGAREGSASSQSAARSAGPAAQGRERPEVSGKLRPRDASSPERDRR
jgi:NitT/TauT family transport system ATP-binding protein